MDKMKLNNIYGKFAKEPIYTPTALFLASCRNKLFEEIKAHYKKFVYCDTDSIHIIGKVKTLEIEDE